MSVNRSVSDQFYRYKMSRLIAKVEGKGNGIKTVIVNMVDVAKALNRPPTYPTKYFGCELGAQTQFDVKNDRWAGEMAQQFCHNNKKAQRYLLHGLECVVAMHQAQLISKIPHILKEMYDADLLEEKVIISWSEKKYVSKELAKEIRVKAEPFIKWLKEAEKESSGGEEEDEDENIEVVYSKTASVPKVETVKSDNKDDDIDIDAILKDGCNLA